MKSVVLWQDRVTEKLWAYLAQQFGEETLRRGSLKVVDSEGVRVGFFLTEDDDQIIFEHNLPELVVYIYDDVTWKIMRSMTCSEEVISRIGFRSERREFYAALAAAFVQSV